MNQSPAFQNLMMETIGQNQQENFMIILEEIQKLQKKFIV